MIVLSGVADSSPTVGEKKKPRSLNEVFGLEVKNATFEFSEIFGVAECEIMY